MEERELHPMDRRERERERERKRERERDNSLKRERVKERTNPPLFPSNTDSDDALSPFSNPASVTSSFSPARHYSHLLVVVFVG